MPSINAAGFKIIENFEGCRLHAYDDGTGVITIGYGHTPATLGDTITLAQAVELLAKDVSKFEQGVNSLCARPLNSNQFSALVSFAFNVGLQALADSTLMHLVNAGNFSEAAHQFAFWVHAGGKVLPGLVARRQAEATLFSAKEVT